MYKAKPNIDKYWLLSLYHSYIRSYINYGSIAWGSTTRSNLKRIYSQQKHAIQIVYSKDRLSHTKGVLNVYQANIWRNLVFMHQINSNTVPAIFLNKFKKPTHNYPTNFARTNYSIPPFKLIEILNFNLRPNVMEKHSNQYRKKSNRRPISLKP